MARSNGPALLTNTVHVTEGTAGAQARRSTASTAAEVSLSSAKYRKQSVDVHCRWALPLYNLFQRSLQVLQDLRHGQY